MKIRGKQKFNTPRKVVSLTRTTFEDGVEGVEDVQIRVRALPMGVDQKMFDLFPEVVKAQEYAKNPAGVIMRDPETKKTILIDVNTPETREAEKKITHNRMAYVIFHGIDDPQVDFEMGDEDNSKPEFYQKVFVKLVEFGFTMGDLGKLMSEITGLMNLSEDIETAKGN